MYMVIKSDTNIVKVITFNSVNQHLLKNLLN